MLYLGKTNMNTGVTKTVFRYVCMCPWGELTARVTSKAIPALPLLMCSRVNSYIQHVK